jgi:hypothetical protein
LILAWKASKVFSKRCFGKLAARDWTRKAESYAESMAELNSSNNFPFIDYSMIDAEECKARRRWSQ